MKRRDVRCPLCGNTFSTRDKNAYCNCIEPPTRCIPVSVARAVDRVLGTGIVPSPASDLDPTTPTAVE